MNYHRLVMENHTIFAKKVFERLRHLSVGQPKILEYLYANDGAVQKTIAQACQIKPATVTSLLSRMEKIGLIERKCKNGDKRYICVYLTALGRKESESVVEAFETVERETLKGFTEAEKEQFVSYLERANKNLKECARERLLPRC